MKWAECFGLGSSLSFENWFWSKADLHGVRALSPVWFSLLQMLRRSFTLGVDRLPASSCSLTLPAKKDLKKLRFLSYFSTWSLISLRTLSVTTMEKFFLFLFFHLKLSMWVIDFQPTDLKTGNSSTCEIAWSDFSSSPAGPESVNPRKKYQGRTCIIMFSNCSWNSDWICLRI